MKIQPSINRAWRPLLGFSTTPLMVGLSLCIAQQAGAATHQLNGPAELSYSANGASGGAVYRCNLDGTAQGLPAVLRYDTISPGTYSVTLRSASTSADDGQTALYAFRVEPMWFQTLWCRTAVSLILLAGLFAVHRLRMRQVTRRVRAQLSIQQVDRERFSQQLNDALLQGAQGLVWRFHALAERLPKDSPVRLGMYDALEVADRTLAEGRERATTLRETLEGPRQLELALRASGSELAQDRAATFSMSCDGDEAAMSPPLQQEVLNIASQLLIDAFSRERATHVDVHMQYARSELRISIRDDGVVQPVAPDSHELAAPDGVSDFADRLQVLGGNLNILQRFSGGTEVRLRVPVTLS